MEIQLELRHYALALFPAVYLAATGRFYVSFLKAKLLGQYIREDGPKSHQKKSGTPTMGGLMLFDAVAIAMLLYTFIAYQPIWSYHLYIVLGVFLAFGFLGFADDYLKVAKKHNKGVHGYTKLSVQFAVGLLVGIYLWKVHGRDSVDLLGMGTLQLGVLYPILVSFIITGASNAVNLTDGLDGLASSCMTISLIGISIVVLMAGTSLSGALPLAMVGFIVASACIGFLLYNRNPAQLFMGDTGSLALGGILGALCVVAGLELWLILFGFIYVVETLSVMLQVASFKLTGNRIFKMAPLHHHFELCGLNEQKVVTLFAGVQLLVTVLAVALYHGS